jgi:hypothetical protein
VVVSLRVDHVQRAHAELLEGWVADFQGFREKVLAAHPDLPSTLPARGDSKEALALMIEIARSKVDEARPDMRPAPSYRLDAYIRVEALLRRLRKIIDPVGDESETARVVRRPMRDGYGLIAQVAACVGRHPVIYSVGERRSGSPHQV